jgi:hypothetical protein
MNRHVSSSTTRHGTGPVRRPWINVPKGSLFASRGPVALWAPANQVRVRSHRNARACSLHRQSETHIDVHIAWECGRTVLGKFLGQPFHFDGSAALAWKVTKDDAEVS